MLKQRGPHQLLMLPCLDQVMKQAAYPFHFLFYFDCMDII